MASYTWKAGAGDTGGQVGSTPEQGTQPGPPVPTVGSTINTGSHCDAAAPPGPCKMGEAGTRGPSHQRLKPWAGSSGNSSTDSECWGQHECFQQGQPLTQARQHLEVLGKKLLQKSSYTRAGHVGCWKELSSLAWAAQEQPGLGHGSLKGSRGCSNSSWHLATEADGFRDSHQHPATPSRDNGTEPAWEGVRQLHAPGLVATGQPWVAWGRALHIPGAALQHLPQVPGGCTALEVR